MIEHDALPTSTGQKTGARLNPPSNYPAGSTRLMRTSDEPVRNENRHDNYVLSRYFLDMLLSKLVEIELYHYNQLDSSKAFIFPGPPHQLPQLGVFPTPSFPPPRLLRTEKETSSR